MSDVSTFDGLSLEALTKAAQESFIECQQVFSLIERKWNHLEHFGRILSAAKQKVPYGEWDSWLTVTFDGKLPSRTARRWIAESQNPQLGDDRREKTRKNIENERPHVAEVKPAEPSVEIVDPPQRLKKTGTATVQPDYSLEDEDTEPEANPSPAASQASIMLDSLGRQIPPLLRSASELAIQLNAVGRELDKYRQAAKDFAEQPGGEWLRLQDIDECVRTLKGHFQGARYHTACPKCGGQGAGCKKCDGAGWIPDYLKATIS